MRSAYALIAFVVCLLLAGCIAQTTLTILTVPNGSTVVIDGSSYVAPVKEMVAEPGVVDIEVSHVGYLPERVFVDVMKGNDNRYTVTLDTERHVDAENKPILTEKGFRIRTLPGASDATCFISCIGTGETHTFDLEETPVTGDWTKILPLAGFGKDTRFVDVAGLAVCSDGDGNFGVCSLGSLTDAILKLENVNWRHSRPNWSYLRLKQFDDDVATTIVHGNSHQLMNDDKPVSIYEGDVSFHGRKTDKTSVWNYITSEGRQSIVILDGDSVKPIWEGQWALGAFNHLDEVASPIDFIDDETIATVVCPSTGYKLVVMGITDGNILSQREVDVFPANITVNRYGDVSGINLEYSNLVNTTFTWTKELGFANIPDISNGDFKANVGTWLPVGNNRFELRFPGESSLSVCFKMVDDKLVAVWAGSIK